jgi:2-C-methyl-D-erythritol 4-phosphate cytidylyltransferase
MIPPRSVSVIVVAAGEGRRMGGSLRKPWLELAGVPVVARTVERFASLDFTRDIILVVHPDDVARAEALGKRFPALCVVQGGAHRVESVRAGIAAVSKDATLVAVQDGVRPLVTEAVIRRTCEAALKTGAALPVVPVLATLKEVGESGSVSRTVAREKLFEAQTPQVFRVELLRRAYDALGDANVTDDAQVVEKLGHAVAAVEGSRHNIKITTPEDLKLAELFLRMEE